MGKSRSCGLLRGSGQGAEGEQEQGQGKERRRYPEKGENNSGWDCVRLGMRREGFQVRECIGEGKLSRRSVVHSQ